MSTTAPTAPSGTAALPGTAAPARHPRRWLVLAFVLVAEVMDLLDGMIVNVAAPSIRADLGGSAATLQWLGAAYTLTFAVLLITGGRLGDIVGRRRLFMVGIVGFTVASGLCAAAASPGMLIGLRALQGAFGALLIPQGFGMLKEVFEEDELPKAFMFFGPVMGLSAVAAPVIGGALVDADLLGSGWRAIFLVNLPLGIAGLAGALRILPRTGGTAGTRLDPVGALLVCAASLALVYPLVEGRELGWPLWIFGLLAASAAGFALFGLHERRHRERALLPPSLVRNGAFTSGLLVAVCFFAAMIGLSLVLSLACQLGEGFSPLRTGLTLAPFAVGVALTAGASYPLAARFGRAAMQGGFAVMGAGLALLAVMAAHAGDHVTTWTLLPGQLVAGMGMGIALPPLFDFILAGVGEDEVGSASGVLNAVQQLGGALGIAIVATIFFAYAHGGRPTGGTLASTTWWTLVLVAAAFVAVWRLPRRAREHPLAG